MKKNSFKFLFLSLLPLLFSCGAGVNGTGGGSGSGGSSVKRIFVTSSTFSSNLGGLSGADSDCTTVADNAGLGGTWKAWLSDSSSSAISRVNDVGPWYLVDKTTLVFQNLAAMVSSNPLAAINQDQTGAVTSQTHYFTATLANGNGAAINCANWTSTAGGPPLELGVVGSTTGSGWTSVALGTCGINEALLCIEQ